MNRFDWVFLLTALATYIALGAWFQMGILPWDFTFFLLIFSSLLVALAFALFKLNSRWYARMEGNPSARLLYRAVLIFGAFAAAVGIIQAQGFLSGSETNLIGIVATIAVVAILLRLRR